MLNIWDQDGIVVIPTNGKIKQNGECVMGAGLALQAKDRFPGLSKELGDILSVAGNHVVYFETYSLITFPTKDHWKQSSCISLIERSAAELSRLILRQRVFVPRVGCGLGGLDWSQVKPILQKYLNNERYVLL